jgi:uncharacterized delta-60 repeat protein
MKTSIAALGIAASFVALRASAGAGRLDPTFVAEPSVAGNVSCIVVQPDGKVLVGGDVSGTIDPPICRLNQDGSLDPSFVPDGIPLYGDCIALQTNGQILAGGGGGVVRLFPDGSRDSTFNVAVQLASGGPDVYSIVVQPDGKILIGGAFDTVNNIPRGDIARLNNDGTVDTTFDPGTGISGIYAGYWSQVSSIALQPDGKIVIGGPFAKYNGQPRNDVTRLNTDGSLDGTFDPNLSFTDIWGVNAVALQPDKKIVVGGGVWGCQQRLLARAIRPPEVGYQGFS